MEAPRAPLKETVEKRDALRKRDPNTLSRGSFPLGLCFIHDLSASSPLHALTHMHAARSCPRSYRANKRTEADSVFVQIFSQLRGCVPADLAGGRAWEVQFAGEGATDCGGPYSESLSQLCAELHSPAVPLFVPCPNARAGVGANRDRWVPNAALADPVHLAQFEFVGALMGVAVRAHEPLALCLPTLVWKALTGQPRDLSDVDAIDRLGTAAIAAIRNSPSPAAFEAEFGTASSDAVEGGGLTFTATTGDGSRIVELCPGGRTRSVTWANHLEYADLLERQRIHEFDTQLQVRGSSPGFTPRTRYHHHLHPRSTARSGRATNIIEYF